MTRMREDGRTDGHRLPTFMTSLIHCSPSFHPSFRPSGLNTVEKGCSCPLPSLLSPPPSTDTSVALFKRFRATTERPRARPFGLNSVAVVVAFRVHLTETT